MRYAKQELLKTIGMGVAVFCTLMAGFIYFSQPPAWITKAEAKAAIADLMKDPNSARFKNVSILHNRVATDVRFQEIVCADVNARNSYGAYGGYSRYIAWRDTEGGKIVAVKDSMDLCGTVQRSHMRQAYLNK